VSSYHRGFNTRDRRLITGLQEILLSLNLTLCIFISMLVITAGVLTWSRHLSCVDVFDDVRLSPSRRCLVTGIVLLGQAPSTSLVGLPLALASGGKRASRIALVLV
jgi:hypothetical protein